LLCLDRNNPMNGSDQDISGNSDENINWIDLGFSIERHII
jgi:hypothetical protein